MIRAFVHWLIRRSLRRTFRRICWVGDWPPLPEERPIVLYANHQYFHDSYLLWLLLRKLGRDTVVWMRELERFPLFRAAGALPFPEHDPARRASTFRTTVRRMRSAPPVALIYFPEGDMHSPDERLHTLPTPAMTRLHDLLPAPLWWPVAVHVTWRGEPLPTALMTGGALHEGPTGHERERLTRLRQTLRSPQSQSQRLLSEGKRPLSEWWRFPSWLTSA